MKAKRMLAVLLAFVMVLTNVWSTPVFAEETQEQEYRLENLREKDHTWFFADEEVIIPLNADGLDGITDIIWNLGIYEEETDTFTSFESMEGVDASALYTVSEDKMSVTLHGSGFEESKSILKDESWFDLSVEVYAGEEVIFNQGIGVSLAEEMYNYSFPYIYPGDDQMLVEESRYVGNSMHVWYQNSENPYGADAEVAITNVEVTSQYTWDEAGNEIEVPLGIGMIVEVWGSQEGGWDIFGNDHGFADIAITYVTVNGEEAVYNLRMWSVGEYYLLERDYPNGNNNMLQDSEMEVGTRVIRRFLDEEGNHCEEEMMDYTLSIRSGEEEGTQFDDGLVSIVANENAYTVTSNQIMGYTEAWISARGEYNDAEYYVESLIEINVCDMYYNIEPLELTDAEGNRWNCEMGGILDMTGLESAPVLYYYAVGQERMEVTEDVRYRLEYDDENWRPTEETAEDTLPVLRRFSAWGSSVTLIAEISRTDDTGETYWEEAARREYWFDGLDYSVWFDDFQNGWNAYLFEDQEITFHLNTENLSDKENCSVSFDVGVYSEDQFVPFENQEMLFSTVTEEDGSVTGITFHGSALKEIRSSMYDELWFELRVTVTVNGLVANEQCHSIELLTEYIDYYYDHGEEQYMLPNWGIGFNKEITYYVENAQYPDGYEGVVEISDVRVEVQDGAEDMLPVYVWDDGQGWSFDPQSYGYAKIIITHPKTEESSELVERVINVWVVDEMWNVYLYPADSTDRMLPGSEKEMLVDVSRERYNEEDDTNFTEIPEDIEIVWEAADEDSEQYITITPNSENPKSAQIVANENIEGEEWPGVTVRIYPLDENGDRVTDEEGNAVESASQTYWFHISQEYLEIEPKEVDLSVGVGETLDIKTLYPELGVYRYKVGGEKTKLTEDIRIRLEYDEGVWQPTEESADELIPVLTRIEAWNGEIRLIAEEKYVNGEEEGWAEIARRSYWYDGLDYSTWFENLQEGGYGWIYDDGEMQFDLFMGNLSDKTYDIEFKIGVELDGNFTEFERQAELFEKVTDSDGNVTGIKLDGTALKAYKDSMYDGCWFNVRYIVKGANDIIVQEGGSEVELRSTECEYYYSDEIVMLPHNSLGQTKTIGYYFRNSEYPDGAWGEVEITEMSVEVIDGAEDAVVLNEWEGGDGWNIEANSVGHAIITIKHPSAMNPDETVTQEIPVWIQSEIWGVVIETSTGHWNLLKGDSVDYTARVWRDYYDEREDCNYSETVENVEFEWNYVDEEWSSTLITFTQDAETPNVLHVSAKEDAEANVNAGISVRVYPLDEDGNRLTDEEGNDIEVAYNESWLYVCDEYVQIEPSHLEINTEPEGILDLVSLYPDLGVYLYKSGQERVKLDEGVRLRLEYDESVWQLTEETQDELMPVLKRISREGTNLVIIAEELYADRESESWNEIMRNSYWVDRVNYDIWFEDMPNGNRVFEDGDATFNLNTDNLAGKENYSLIIEVGGWYNDEFVMFEPQENVYELVENEDGQITGITLKGTEIAKVMDDSMGTWFEVRMRVEVEGEVVSENGHSFELCEELCNYEYQYYGVSLLPGWEADLNKWFSVYVENAEIPQGERINVEITDVAVEVIDGEADMLTVKAYEDGSGWDIIANKTGYAQITLTHTLADDENATGTHVFDVWVVNDIWNVDFTTDTGKDCMLPGGAMELSAIVSQECYDEENGYYEGDTSNKEVTWEWYDDSGVFEFTPDESGKLHIQASEYAEEGAWADITLRVYEFDENGDYIEFATGYFHVYIGPKESVIEYEFGFVGALGQLQVGQTITVITTVTNPSDYDLNHVYVGMGCADYPAEWAEILATENERYEVTGNGAYIETLQAGETVEVTFEKVVPAEWFGREIEFGGGVYVMGSKEMTFDNILYEATMWETSRKVSMPFELSYSMDADSELVAGEEVNFTATVMNTGEHTISHTFVGMGYAVNEGEWWLNGLDVFTEIEPSDRYEVIGTDAYIQDLQPGETVTVNFSGIVSEDWVGKEMIFLAAGQQTTEADVNTIIADRTQRIYATVAAPTIENPFEDVQDYDFFYNPVLWAYSTGVTSGKGATTFAPNDVCTRADVVTFLWRAAGRPEPQSTVCPFVDVPNYAYYYKAVLWAVENRITSGTSETTFEPGAECTRAQVVAFLWRAAGSEQPKATESTFVDVPNYAYYYKAVLWAVENKITAGVSQTTFAPENACTRGQIVTFLYRHYN